MLQLPLQSADVFAMEPFGSVLYQLPMRLSDLRELILINVQL